jgi:hypothetical protein
MDDDKPAALEALLTHLYTDNYVDYEEWESTYDRLILHCDVMMLAIKYD